jgi:hypothetical protein
MIKKNLMLTGECAYNSSALPTGGSQCIDPRIDMICGTKQRR